MRPDIITKFCEDKRERDYEPHELPVLGERRREHLLVELCKETCESRRRLLDIRFKLLGMVPAVSFVFIGTLLSSEGLLKSVDARFRIALAILGVVATLGLLIYELRNSNLYNDLGSRARRIEYELGVHTGQFLGRLKCQNLVVDHRFAVDLIYVAALVAWLICVIALWQPEWALLLGYL